MRLESLTGHFHVAEPESSTGGSRLMQISLLRISLLRFFKTFHKFGLCVVLMRIFGSFISLVRIIWLYLANANFG